MSKVLVIVHGAGKTMSDFYKKPVADLTAELDAAPACLPCWYGKLANIGSPVFAPAGSDADAFRARLIEQLKQQQAMAAAPPTGVVSFGLASMAATVADLVADVTRYLYDADLRDDMRSCLQEVMEQAKDYDETILVSHSLGTVLAYDVLCQHADAYNVSHFITMGSPLRKVVNAGARSNDLGVLTEQNVAMWRNLYDTHDPVANVIGQVFPDYPIQDVLAGSQAGAIDAHDYWGRKSVVRMIAGFLK